jgi:hypothetical protein
MAAGGRAPAWRGRSATLLVAVGLLLAGTASGLQRAAWAARRGAPAGPTRADLHALRRLAAQLEAQAALEATRRPYLVLDLGARTLQYRLLGMMLREIPLRSAAARGLRPAPGGARPEAGALAGIFTLQEKDDDPRLTPLTPEQVEAGAGDENAADVMPPEAPSVFGLRFRQPVLIMIEGAPEGEVVRGALASATSFWRRLWGRAGGHRPGEDLRLALRLDDTAAREVYRSLIPGQRVLIVAPDGLLLPEAGQERAGSIRPARPRPTPAPPPPTAPPGVPFRIPPPVEGLPGPEGDGAPPGEAPTATPPAGQEPDGPTGEDPGSEPRHPPAAQPGQEPGGHPGQPPGEEPAEPPDDDEPGEEGASEEGPGEEEPGEEDPGDWVPGDEEPEEDEPAEEAPAAGSPA